MSASTLLIVFAKAPLPGQVKTRLIPSYGEAGAANIHEQLVRCVLNQATTVPAIDIELHVALGQKHPFFWQLRRQYGLTLKSQVDGDLGKKMLMAIRHGLKTYQHVLIVGTDWAAFDVNTVQQATAALHQHDYVFVPAEDGGYVLIGARKDNIAPFRGITWGQPQVMQQTERALRRQQLSYHCLATSWDVDHAEDVQRAVAEGLITGIAAPTTTGQPEQFSHFRQRMQKPS